MEAKKPKQKLRSNPTPLAHYQKMEFATLEWVEWFNNRVLLTPMGNVSLPEFDVAYYRQLEESADSV